MEGAADSLISTWNWASHAGVELLNPDMTWVGYADDSCPGISSLGRYAGLVETTMNGAFCLNYAIAITTPVSLGNANSKTPRNNTEDRVWASTTGYSVDTRIVTVDPVSVSKVDVVFSDGYQPFGQDNESSGSESYRFTGKPYSSATGLYYSFQRWYDPSIGRFISQDQILCSLSYP